MRQEAEAGKLAAGTPTTSLTSESVGFSCKVGVFYNRAETVCVRDCVNEIRGSYIEQESSAIKGRTPGAAH